MEIVLQREGGVMEIKLYRRQRYHNRIYQNKKCMAWFLIVMLLAGEVIGGGFVNENAKVTAHGNMSLYTVSEANKKAVSSLWYEQEEGLQADRDAAEGTVIAVIDTGADITHNALRDHLWVNEAEKNGEEGVDDDGNGYVDDVYGYNVRGDNGNVTDSDGHGTHVAGILGMETDGKRNFGYGASIMIVKAGNSQNGFSSANCAKAIRYAVKNGADVITMSLGADYMDETLEKAIHMASKKAVIVAAAGNESAPTKESGYSDAVNIFPAGLSDVLGVMAYDSDRDLAWFSNWDYRPDTEVDYEIAAPGTEIYSTWPGGGFQKESGTSMAAPIAAGACAALVKKWKNQGCYEPAAMIGQLVYTADQYIVKTDQMAQDHYFPRINLQNALNVTPQPHLHVQSAGLKDAAGNRESIEISGSGSGDMYSLELALADQWAAAEDIRVELTSLTEHAEVSAQPYSLERMAGRERQELTGENALFFSLEKDGEDDREVLLDLTIRYKNGYLADGKGYITKGKLLLKEEEEEISYIEEEFLAEETVEAPASSVSPEPKKTYLVSPEPSASRSPEETQGASSHPSVSRSPEETYPVVSKPSTSPIVKEMHTALPELSTNPAPRETYPVSSKPLAGPTVSEPSVVPGPSVSPALKKPHTALPKPSESSGLKKKKLLCSVKCNKKKLVIRTIPAAQIKLEIYPEKYTLSKARKKGLAYICKGKSDKKGIYTKKIRIKKLKKKLKKKNTNAWRIHITVKKAGRMQNGEVKC